MNVRSWVLMVGVLGLIETSTDLTLHSALAASPATTKPIAVLAETGIRASHIVHHAPGSLPARSVGALASVNLKNLFIVLESGDQHATVLDGDRFEPVHRFPTRADLLESVSFTPDGRHAIFASRDGWISKFDLWNLALVAEIRAGTQTNGIAISSDGKFIAVANAMPNTLVLLDADLNLLKVHAVTGKDGKISSSVSAILDAAPRRSFVAALKGLPEVWEISYNPTAEDVPIGLVHDFQYKEGTFIPGFLNPRRTATAERLDNFFLAADHNEIIAAGREPGSCLVINLDVRKQIAGLTLGGTPHPAAGIAWQWQGKFVLAVPDRLDGLITLVDLHTWKTVASFRAPGPALSMHSHGTNPFAWILVSTGKTDGALVVFDKRSLEKIIVLPVAVGESLSQVEFTRDGKYALVTIAKHKSDGGAIVVFDAATFKEIKRIPMHKPIGNYNIHNRINRAERIAY